MAHQWTCTLGTVNRAYAVLAREGLVVGHRGKGTLVAPSQIQPSPPIWDWAALVNRAEQFLLVSISSGHRLAEVEAALSVAASRWRELQRRRRSQSELL